MDIRGQRATFGLSERVPVSRYLSKRMATYRIANQPPSFADVNGWEGFNPQEKEIVKSLLSPKSTTGRALPVMNTTISEQDNITMDEDSEKSVLAGLEMCVAKEAEDVGIQLLSRFVGVFPLSLVHRAGERRLLRLLRKLHDLRIPITSHKVVNRFRAIALRYARKKSFCPDRTGSDFVTGEDLLSWAWWLALVRDLLKLRKIEITAEAVLVALHFSHLELAITMQRVGCIQSTGFQFLHASRWCDYRVIQKLCELALSPATVTAALHVLSLVPLQQWGQVEIDSLVLALQDVSSSRDVEASVIVNCGNPLLLCVTACELCKKVREWSRTSVETFSRLADRFGDIAGEIQGQYVDYSKLKTLYMEKGPGDMSVFDLITSKPDEYRRLLMSETVASIAQNLWRSEGQLSLGFSDYCAFIPYIHQIVDFRSLWTVKIAIRPLRESVFQFNVWKRDGLIRHIAETACLLAMFIVLIYILKLYVDVNLTVLDGIKSLSVLNEAVFMTILLERFRNLFAGYTYCLMANHFQSILHLALLKQPLSVDPRFYVDFLMTVTITMIFAVSENRYFGAEQSGAELIGEGLYGILFLLNGLRICMILLQTETFGPILRMIYLIARGISAYLLIFLISLFTFSFVFNALFWRETEFKSILLSFRTLFSWSVGGFDPSLFHERDVLGSTLGCMWALVSAVLLLNLLVAVLSSRLEKLNPQARADYVSILYHSYRQAMFEPKFGALVVAPTPFNCLTLPCIPLYLLVPQYAETVTKWFTILSYQISFLVGLSVFTLWNAAMFPIAYILTIWKLIEKRVWDKQGTASFIWVLFGPVQLILIWVWSYKAFVVGMYAEPICRMPEVKYSFLKTLKKHLQRITADQKDDCFLPMNDILPTLVKFPKWRNAQTESLSKQSAGLFSHTVERIYFSNSDIQKQIFNQCADLLSQFVSFRREKERNSEKRVNLKRLVAMMDQMEGNPEGLICVNIEVAQYAVLKVAKEPSLR